MRSQTTRIRLGAVALAIAGLLFLLYPLVRPWEDETTAAGAAQAMSQGAWVASHGFAMAGFVLVGLGVLAVWGALRHTVAEPAAAVAVALTWVGVGLTLPYYGAETFGLHAIASAAAAGETLDLLAIVDDVRFDPVAMATFGLGLVALAAGAALLAVAIRRSRALAPGAGLMFALGFVLFLPQFLAPAPVRIAHGALVAVGCVVLARAVWKPRPR